MVVALSVHSMYLEEWNLFLQKNGVEVKKMDFFNTTADSFAECQGAVWHYGDKKELNQPARVLLDYLGGRGLSIFPKFDETRMFDSKVSQSVFFKLSGIASPEAFIFTDEGDAIEWIRSFPLPVVHKSSSGAGSSGVSLVTGVRQGERIIKRAFRKGISTDLFPPDVNFPLLRSFVRKMLFWTGLCKVDIFNRIIHKHPTLRYESNSFERGLVYFQRYLAGNRWDYRATVIGDKIFCMRRFNRKNDFRASGSDKQDLNPSEIPKTVLELAFSLSEKTAMNRSVAADIIFSEGKEPQVIEISYSFANALKTYPGYWSRDLVWNARSVSRLEVLVENFVTTLKQRG